MKAPFSLVLVSLFTVVAQPLRAAPTPTEELLRFVPPDVSFCLVLRDLRGHSAALKQSPFVQSVRRPFGVELQQLEQAEKMIEKLLGVSLDSLRDDILGDAVVFAYRPGPPGKPDQEQGLILVRAREAQPLAQLVERMNKMVKEVREVEHDGFKYARRVEGNEVNFLHLRDRVLVFSGQEALLREALALEKRTTAEQQSAIGRSLEEMGGARSLAALWVNPRSFDTELEGRWKNAGGAEEKAFLGTFLSCWRAIDTAVYTVSLTKDLELGLTVRGRPEALPKAVRHFFDESAEPADLWARFSDNALLAVGARTPAAALLSFFGAFQGKEAFEQAQEVLNRRLATALGRKDLMNDVLPHVGPDWGLSICAPQEGDKGWFPSMLFALRVAAGKGAPPIDRALIRQLDAIASFAIFGFNAKLGKDPLVSQVITDGGLEIFSFGNTASQAMGLQPAFGLCDGYLVIASTPETLKRFAAAKPSRSKLAETPLVRISFKHLREYLKSRRQTLTTMLAEQHGQTPQQVGKHLDQLVAGLGLFDRLELTQKTSPGQVGFTLRLRPTEPLRK